MADSFFTARNGYDEQAARWPEYSCNDMVEAMVRRQVTLIGANAVAVKLYRLADICAARHVAPLDIRPAGEVAPSAPPASIGSLVWQLLVGRFSFVSYALGLAVGFLMRGGWPF